LQGAQCTIRGLKRKLQVLDTTFGVAHAAFQARCHNKSGNRYQRDRKHSQADQNKGTFHAQHSNIT